MNIPEEIAEILALAVERIPVSIPTETRKEDERSKGFEQAENDRIDDLLILIHHPYLSEKIAKEIKQGTYQGDTNSEIYKTVHKLLHFLGEEKFNTLHDFILKEYLNSCPEEVLEALESKTEAKASEDLVMNDPFLRYTYGNLNVGLQLKLSEVIWAKKADLQLGDHIEDLRYVNLKSCETPAVPRTGITEGSPRVIGFNTPEYITALLNEVRAYRMTQIEQEISPEELTTQDRRVRQRQLEHDMLDVYRTLTICPKQCMTAISEMNEGTYRGETKSTVYFVSKLLSDALGTNAMFLPQAVLNVYLNSIPNIRKGRTTMLGLHKKVDKILRGGVKDVDKLYRNNPHFYRMGSEVYKALSTATERFPNVERIRKIKTEHFARERYKAIQRRDSIEPRKRKSGRRISM